MATITVQPHLLLERILSLEIVRGCDVKRNVLVYMVYSDKIIEGSPKNSTSSVPIMPWGASGEVQKCGDWIEG